MPDDLQALMSRLEKDPWRQEHAFTPEVSVANDKLFATTSDDAAVGVMSEWLAKYQPCLFGRIAAKREQLSYCVLREDDLRHGDESVRDKIQRCRRQWTAEGFYGQRSGFIVFLISQRIAEAAPNESMLAVARSVAELYLLQDIAPDQIYLDELFLETPTSPVAAWRWAAGVNYFCAQGDGRWWHDHRIPGGMAFSVNSVGHMAKSGKLAESLSDLAADLDLEDLASIDKQPVASLFKALELAMMTIDRAAATESGKATRLLPLPPDHRELPVFPCPVQLPKPLEDKNYCTYGGYYHTDVTLPREYFAPDIQRPQQQEQLSLDFTYLFDDSLDNPDFIRMGKGLRIRESEDLSRERLLKRRRSLEDKVMVEQSARLVNALKEFSR